MDSCAKRFDPGGELTGCTALVSLLLVEGRGQEPLAQAQCCFLARQ
jgi:hypothetical protein